MTESEEKSIVHLTARNEAATNHSDQETPLFNGGRKEAKMIRIEVSWSPDNKEIICEPKASESFVRFVTRLYEIKGGDVLAKLSACKFSRGILLSKTPHVDFSYTRNDGRQTEYSNQPIANSGYCLLTHGETWQKTADIAEICRVLGLPLGTIKVEEIEKSDLFKEFVV